MTAPQHLLDEAVRVLREDLAPTLAGTERYLALLAAKAVDTARRELALQTPLASLAAELPTTVEALRDGSHEDDHALYAALLDAAILRAHVCDPTALNADERGRLDALSR